MVERIFSLTYLDYLKIILTQLKEASCILLSERQTSSKFSSFWVGYFPYLFMNSYISSFFISSLSKLSSFTLNEYVIKNLFISNTCKKNLRNAYFKSYDMSKSSAILFRTAFFNPSLVVGNSKLMNLELETLYFLFGSKY